MEWNRVETMQINFLNYLSCLAVLKGSQGFGLLALSF